MESQIPRWAQEPWPVIVNHFDKLKAGTVLDLGGSDGVNDLFLAEKGFEVTNVDIDQGAVADFLANGSNLKIHGIVSDLSTFEIPHKFDNIMSLYSLHFLEDAQALNLIEQMQNNTEQEGINLIAVFTNHSRPGNFKVENDRLLDLYKEWDVLSYFKRAGRIKDETVQETTFLIAKKK